MSDITPGRIFANCMGARRRDFKYKTESDGLITHDRDTTVLGKLAEVKYRSNNSFGAKSISYSYFLFSNDDKLLDVADNKVEILSKSCLYVFDEFYNNDLYFDKVNKYTE